MEDSGPYGNPFGWDEIESMDVEGCLLVCSQYAV